MAFEGLTDKLQAAFKKLSGKGKLSEADVREAMREVRMALLEADVNFVVVKDFIKRVTERAVGQEILGSLTPAQMVIKIVNEELTGLMGGTGAKLTNCMPATRVTANAAPPTPTPTAATMPSTVIRRRASSTRTNSGSAPLRGRRTVSASPAAASASRSTRAAPSQSV